MVSRGLLGRAQGYLYKEHGARYGLLGREDQCVRVDNVVRCESVGYGDLRERWPGTDAIHSLQTVVSSFC